MSLHKMSIKVFFNISKELAQDEFNCSLICNCESSGQTSQDYKILACLPSRFSICHTCTLFHQNQESSAEGNNQKRKATKAEPLKLQDEIALYFPAIAVVGEIMGIYNLKLQGQLQCVARTRGYWLLTPGAGEGGCSGRQIAEIQVQLGQIGALKKDMGLAAYIKSI